MIDKVYVTKYALTDGVRRCEVKNLKTHHHVRSEQDYVTVVWEGGYNGESSFALGRDAHVTLADAEDAFDKMRASAIKSAEKKLERLRAMKFEVKE